MDKTSKGSRIGDETAVRSRLCNQIGNCEGKRCISMMEREQPEEWKLDSSLQKHTHAEHIYQEKTQGKREKREHGMIRITWE